MVLTWKKFQSALARELEISEYEVDPLAPQQIQAFLGIGGRERLVPRLSEV